jgi:hypothetical protein
MTVHAAACCGAMWFLLPDPWAATSPRLFKNETVKL